jgi:hypothetical protein
MKHKKLEKLDLRDVSLMLRTSVDNLDDRDLNLHVLLGFFHGIFLKIIARLNFDFDTFTLNLRITDFIKNAPKQPSKEAKLEINGISLQEIFSIFRSLLEDSGTEDILLMYIFGFSHGLLNRIMRKLGIDYQIPMPG